jgi:hypothetical protein
MDGIFGTVHSMHDIDHATSRKCTHLTNNWVFTFPQARTISNQLVSVQELFIHVYLTQLLPTLFLSPCPLLEHRLKPRHHRQGVCVCVILIGFGYLQTWNPKPGNSAFGSGREIR